MRERRSTSPTTSWFRTCSELMFTGRGGRLLPVATDQPHRQWEGASPTFAPGRSQCRADGERPTDLFVIGRGWFRRSYGVLIQLGQQSEEGASCQLASSRTRRFPSNSAERKIWRNSLNGERHPELLSSLAADRGQTPTHPRRLSSRASFETMSLFISR
jgi:hypothetical protein